MYKTEHVLQAFYTERHYRLKSEFYRKGSLEYFCYPANKALLNTEPEALERV